MRSAGLVEESFITPSVLRKADFYEQCPLSGKVFEELVYNGLIGADCSRPQDRVRPLLVMRPEGGLDGYQTVFLVVPEE